MGEVGGDGEQGEQIAHAIAIKEKVPDSYRGDLNGAYRKWREGGKPADLEHPLTKELLWEARLFAYRSTVKVHLRRDSLAHLEARNDKSIQRAMMLYDPDRKEGASFTTYIKRSVLNNIRDALRHEKNATRRAELLRAHNGDMVVAHWWIDEDKGDWQDIKNGRELVRRVNIKPKDRDLAHWLLEQDSDTKITWRHVVHQFPEYTEDTAGRALKRIRDAIAKL